MTLIQYHYDLNQIYKSNLANKNCQKHINKFVHTITITFLLVAIFTATTATAAESPEQAKDLSLWQQTQQLTVAGFESAKAVSSDIWDDTTAFFEKDNNASLATITASGTGIAVTGASAITTTSILGLATITTAPAWAPVAICAGGAIALVGATHLILENIDE